MTEVFQYGVAPPDTGFDVVPLASGFYIDPISDLAETFSNTTGVYFGIFTVLPDEDGLGGTEGPENRVLVDRWTWAETGTVRTNAEPIRITIELGHVVAGFGVWDAPTAGNLIAVVPFSPDGSSPLIEYAFRDDVAEIEALGLLAGLTTLGALCNLNNEDYCNVAQNLLPYGPAWTGPRLKQFLCGIAREFSRVEWMARRLIEESDPRTTQLLIEEWEAFAGLPGCNGTLGATLEARHQALHAKLTQNLSPTPATFIAIAEALGYTGAIVINNGNPFTCISNCNDSLYGGPWIFTWTLQVDASSANDAILECLVRELTPQHTTVLFEYGP
jgi:uncharacterized protein YmfQ (DUF2313 family)